MPTVFFLSDYGTQDEFVGVVKAVVLAGAPGAMIVDLTHHVPPFDVAAGSRTLVRSVPFVGSGVVLAVVDPGVGTSRRSVALEAVDGTGRIMWFVGPDNGLLVAAAEVVAAAGSAALQVVVLPPHRLAAGVGATFDGRDVFAPAAGALCRGAELASLGPSLDPGDLVRLPLDVVECARDAGGRWTLRCAVTWVDAYGNVQLSVRASDVVGSGLGSSGVVQVVSEAVSMSVSMSVVAAFEELAPDAVGLLWDANGHLAVVAARASAAGLLGLAVGNPVTLTW